MEFRRGYRGALGWVVHAEPEVGAAIGADATSQRGRRAVLEGDLECEQRRAGAGDDGQNAADDRQVATSPHDEDDGDESQDRCGHREQHLRDAPLILAPPSLMVIAYQPIDLRLRARDCSDRARNRHVGEPFERRCPAQYDATTRGVVRAAHIQLDQRMTNVTSPAERRPTMAATTVSIGSTAIA